MNILVNQNVFHIYRKTLNLVDYRLIDHGERVAYILLEMLRRQGGYTAEQTAQICIFALLHDIGAFKTEEINSMADVSELLRFEMRDVAPHSAYGYLFLDNTLPWHRWSEMVLYHHVRYDRLVTTDCRCPALAQMLFVADRFDLLMTLGKSDSIQKNLSAFAGSLFSEEAVSLVLTTNEQAHLMERLSAQDYHEELQNLFNSIRFSEEELISLLKLLVYSIDFRSPVTMSHTFSVVSISCSLARRMGVPQEEMQALYLGALLHDLGKTATPLNILEKPGRLTPYEFSVMRDHVVATKQILDDVLTDEIVQIAVRHHEKLDGSGYPLGLTGKDLTSPQRLVAVADMASALLGRRSYKEEMPKEQVLQILQQEVEDGKICPEAVAALAREYDAVIADIQQALEEPIEKYRIITEQFPKLVDQLAQY